MVSFPDPFDSHANLLNVSEFSADALVVVVVVDQDDLLDEGGRRAGEDGGHRPEQRRPRLVPVGYDDGRGVGEVGGQGCPVLGAALGGSGKVRIGKRFDRGCVRVRGRSTWSSPFSHLRVETWSMKENVSFPSDKLPLCILRANSELFDRNVLRNRRPLQAHDEIRKLLGTKNIER